MKPGWRKEMLESNIARALEGRKSPCTQGFAKRLEDAVMAEVAARGQAEPRVRSMGRVWLAVAGAAMVAVAATGVWMITHSRAQQPRTRAVEAASEGNLGPQAGTQRVQVEEVQSVVPPFDAQSLAALDPTDYRKARAAMRRWARPAADTLPEWKVEQYRRVLLYSRAIMPVDNG